MERGIKAAAFHLQEFLGTGADGLSDAVAVLRAPLQGPENKQVERALEEFEFLFAHLVDILLPLAVECLRLFNAIRLWQDSCVDIDHRKFRVSYEDNGVSTPIGVDPLAAGAMIVAHYLFRLAH